MPGFILHVSAGRLEQDGHSQMSPDNRGCPVMQVLCNIAKTLTAKNHILKSCLILQVSFVRNRRKGVKFGVLLEPPEVFIG